MHLQGFAYKFLNWSSDKHERAIERLNDNASKRADKINETPEQQRFMERRSERLQAGLPTLEARWDLPPNLVIYRDTWDEVEMGDAVYIYEGDGSWIDTYAPPEAYGFIVGKKGNGQFRIGREYDMPIQTHEYLDGSTRTSYWKHDLTTEAEYCSRTRRPNRIIHREELVELYRSEPTPEPTPEPEPVVVPEVDAELDAMWSFV
jgi:hypothetical protein